MTETHSNMPSKKAKYIDSILGMIFMGACIGFVAFLGYILIINEAPKSPPIQKIVGGKTPSDYLSGVALRATRFRNLVDSCINDGRGDFNSCRSSCEIECKDEVFKKYTTDKFLFATKSECIQAVKNSEWFLAWDNAYQTFREESQSEADSWLEVNFRRWCADPSAGNDRSKAIPRRGMYRIHYGWQKNVSNRSVRTPESIIQDDTYSCSFVCTRTVGQRGLLREESVGDKIDRLEEKVDDLNRLLDY